MLDMRSGDFDTTSIVSRLQGTLVRLRGPGTSYMLRHRFCDRCAFILLSKEKSRAPFCA